MYPAVDEQPVAEPAASQVEEVAVELDQTEPRVPEAKAAKRRRRSRFSSFSSSNPGSVRSSRASDVLSRLTRMTSLHRVTSAASGLKATLQARFTSHGNASELESRVKV